jgi:hypothetical protein
LFGLKGKSDTRFVPRGLLSGTEPFGFNTDIATGYLFAIEEGNKKNELPIGKQNQAYLDLAVGCRFGIDRVCRATAAGDTDLQI